MSEPTQKQPESKPWMPTPLVVLINAIWATATVLWVYYFSHMPFGK